MSDEFDIDALARRAGAELRVPPPAAAVDRVHRGHRAHTRRLTAAAVVAVVAVVGIGVAAWPRSANQRVESPPTTVATVSTGPQAPPVNVDLRAVLGKTPAALVPAAEASFAVGNGTNELAVVQGSQPTGPTRIGSSPAHAGVLAPDPGNQRLLAFDEDGAGSVRWIPVGFAPKSATWFGDNPILATSDDAVHLVGGAGIEVAALKVPKLLHSLRTDAGGVWALTGDGETLVLGPDGKLTDGTTKRPAPTPRAETRTANITEIRQVVGGFERVLRVTSTATQSLGLVRWLASGDVLLTVTTEAPSSKPSARRTESLVRVGGDSTTKLVGTISANPGDLPEPPPVIEAHGRVYALDHRQDGLVHLARYDLGDPRLNVTPNALPDFTRFLGTGTDPCVGAQFGFSDRAFGPREELVQTVGWYVGTLRSFLPAPEVNTRWRKDLDDEGLTRLAGPDFQNLLYSDSFEHLELGDPLRKGDASTIDANNISIRHHRAERLRARLGQRVLVGLRRDVGGQRATYVLTIDQDNRIAGLDECDTQAVVLMTGQRETTLETFVAALTAAPDTPGLTTTTTAISTSSKNPYAGLVDADVSVSVSRLGDWRVVELPGSNVPNAAPEAVALVVVKATGDFVSVYGRDLPVGTGGESAFTFRYVATARVGSWLLLGMPKRKLRAVNIDSGVRRDLDVELADKSGFIIDSAWSDHIFASTGSTRIDRDLNVVVANDDGAELADPLAIWTGTEQVVFGIDNNAGGRPPFQPRIFNPTTGAFRLISRPAWWQGRWPVSAPHQGGDTPLAWRLGDDNLLLTDGSVDGFTGLYNPKTDTWRRIDNPPIPTNQGNVVDLTDALIVVRSFTRDDGPDSTKAVRFDKSTLTWSVFSPPFASPPVEGPAIVSRRFGDVWMIGQDARALAVAETRTLIWREATSADQSAWLSYEGSMPASAV
jgi:hypothetical protein